MSSIRRRSTNLASSSSSSSAYYQDTSLPSSSSYTSLANSLGNSQGYSQASGSSSSNRDGDRDKDASGRPVTAESYSTSMSEESDGREFGLGGMANMSGALPRPALLPPITSDNNTDRPDNDFTPDIPPTRSPPFIRGQSGAMRSSYVASSRPPFAHAASAGPAQVPQSNGSGFSGYSPSLSMTPATDFERSGIPPLISSNSSPSAIPSTSEGSRSPGSSRQRTCKNPLYSSLPASASEANFRGNAPISSLGGGPWELVDNAPYSSATQDSPYSSNPSPYIPNSSSRQPSQPYYQKPVSEHHPLNGSARRHSRSHSLLLDPATQIAAELATSSYNSTPYSSTTYSSEYSPRLGQGSDTATAATSNSSFHAYSGKSVATGLGTQASLPSLPVASTQNQPNKLVKNRDRRSTSLSETYDQALPPIPLPPSKERDRSASSSLGLPSRKKSLGVHNSSSNVVAGVGAGPSQSGDSGGMGESESNKLGLKSMFGGFLDLLSQPKRVEISTPYDPVHLTHVGFNVDTGEFTGLPKEWQQLLSDSGISKQEQLAHPQAVVDIVAFYQDATKKETVRPGAEDDDVWQKFGAAHPAAVYGQGQKLGQPFDGFLQPVSLP